MRAAGRCGLCGGASLARVLPAAPRTLRLCARCHLLQVDPAERPTPEAAARRYALHRNRLDDEGYVRFLERLLEPAARLLRPGARGLDFGCGPAPVLAELARRRGFECDVYDPVFSPAEPVPPYDFLLASEVLEHFPDPEAGIGRAVGLVVPGGLFGVMTESWRELDGLERWPYLSDPTHVVFYHAETFRWIAEAFGLRPVWDDGERVRLFRREEAASPPSPP